jgi:RND family efflux transporter MFP subunit
MVSNEAKLRGVTNSLSILVQPTLFLLVGAAFLSGCGDKASTPLPIPEVTTALPVKQPVTDYLEFTGNAQGSAVVDLKARVSGFLTKVNFQDGDLVKEGDLLFEIEPEPYAAGVKLAQAQVGSAQAELQRATLEYNRQLELIKKNAVSVSEVEKWKAQRDAMQASLEKSQAQLEQAQIEYGYTQIKAPFDGRVDRRLKDTGNLVGAGEATLLTTIYRTNPIYVYFSINEKDLVKVRRPKTKNSVEKQVIYAEIEGEEGFPHKGRVDFGATAVDTSTGTLLLRAVLENPRFGMMPKILPGMFVRLRAPVAERPEAILVPDRSIGMDQSGRFVLAAGQGDVVDKKPVKTGALVGSLRVIEEGLNGDERIIVSGMQQARPGSRVKPVEQAAQGAATAK